MTMALKVVDRSIREDFGFRHILWIYSGRRGIHCWVCDPEARALSNEARDAVVTYLSLETGSGENSDKKTKATFQAPMHPHVRRAYDILEPYFETCIADESGQGLLVSKSKFVPILNQLPNEDIRRELYKRWESDDTHTISGAERWQQLKEATSASRDKDDMSGKKRPRVNYAELESWRVELVMKYCYPRLDVNVSKAQNHLLKSPFCVHPKTGRICIPIDPKEADDFDPFKVPTVRALCAQIDAYDGPDVDDIDKTDMKNAMDIFERSFMADLRTTTRREFRDRTEEARAIGMDF